MDLSLRGGASFSVLNVFAVLKKINVKIADKIFHYLLDLNQKIFLISKSMNSAWFGGL